MQNKNSIMVSFFAATIGVMLVISGMVFIIYCLVYERKNNKKIYKESKIIAMVCIILGIIMATFALLYISNNILL